MTFDSRESLTRQGMTSTNHNPNLKRDKFGKPDAHAWKASRNALILANTPNAGAVAIAPKVAETEILISRAETIRPEVAEAVNAAPFFATDAEIETQKVVNVMGIDENDKVAEAMDKVAALLNLNVPALKALCKSRGLTRYSKLRKHELQALLAE